MKAFGDRVKSISSIVSEQFLYVASMIIFSALSFGFSLYSKAYIAPEEYGIYSSCLLLQTYAAYLHIGTLNSFNRDYPQIVGAGNIKEAENYRNTVCAFIVLIFTALIIVVSVLSLTLVGHGNISLLYGVGFSLCSVIVMLSTMENFGNNRCRIDGSFRYISVVTFIEMSAFAIGFILVPICGYYSLYIVYILVYIIGCVCYYPKSYKDIRFRIDKKMLWSIVQTGAPLVVSGFVWTIVNSIDKFVILSFLNVEQLGLYSIAQNAFTYMVIVPSALSQYYYTKMGFLYGKKGSISAISEYSRNITLLISLLTALMAVVAYFGLPILIGAFLPQYLPGVKAAQILVVGLAIYSGTLINSNILTIAKQNAAILRSSIYLCIFNAIVSTGMVVLVNRTIESVAIGTVVSYILNAFVILYQVKKYAEISILSMIKVSIIPILCIVICIPIISILLDNLWYSIFVGICWSFLIFFVYRKKVQRILINNGEL